MNVVTNAAIRAATPKDFHPIAQLLKTESLPTEDLRPDLLHFFVAEHELRVVGAIGLEIYNRDGLLRSLVVDRNYRNQSLAQDLVSALMRYAARKKVVNIYLITTTAEAYFVGKGFSVVERNLVPQTILSSPEFSTLCPSTATVMFKRVPIVLT